MFLCGIICISHFSVIFKLKSFKMLEQCKDLIIRNFVTLMKECNVEVLQKSMIENGIFTQGELNAIFSVISFCLLI